MLHIANSIYCFKINVTHYFADASPVIEECLLNYKKLLLAVRQGSIRVHV